MPELSGRYRVKRLSGLLPPFGVSKVIEGHQGCTYLFGIPVGRFRVVGRRFIYRRWPIVDELDKPAREAGIPQPDAHPGQERRRPGSVTGRGRLLGFLTFCRFRLEPIA